MAALTVGAAAAEVTLGGIRYNGNEVVGPVEANRPSITTAKIAAEVNKVAITKIGDHAFEGCVQLKTVEIPETITSIGEYAFTGCGLLSDVRFSDKVTTIGTYAFAGCTALKSIALPPSTGVIENQTFLGCTGLQNVYFPSASVTIRAQAFEGCTNLKILHYNSQSGTTTPPTQEAPADKQLEVHAAAPLPVTSKPATCKEEGAQKVTVHCYDAKCNKDIYAESRVLPKTDHKPEDIIEVERVEPTCTKPGAEAGKRCKLCGKTVEGLAVIEKNENAHTLIPIPAVAPSCTSAGKTEGEQCSECGKITTEPQDDPQLLHNYTGGNTRKEVAKPATCEVDGIEVVYKICDKCETEEACDECKELKADPEKETEYIAHVEATHTTAAIKAPGHKEGSAAYVVTKEADCTTEGKEEWSISCSVCKKFIRDAADADHPPKTIPATGHTPEKKESDPDKSDPGNCLKDGKIFYKETTCTVCKNPFTPDPEEIKASGQHTWVDNPDRPEETIKKATCKEPGLIKTQGKKCSVCGELLPQETKETPRELHKWSTPKPDESMKDQDEPATCGKEGKSHVIVQCSECHTEEAQVIILPATNLHDYEGSEWKTVKQPTDKEPGLEQRTCNNCDHVDERILPATGDPSKPEDPDEPEKPKSYSITVIQGAGGTASASRSTAQAGDRVTITFSPNSGYELDMIRVITADGKVLEPDSQNRFTMPAASVEIRVTFQRRNTGAGSGATAPGSDSNSNARRTTDVMPSQNAALAAPQTAASEQRFRDIPVGHWAAGEIEWANQMGYMNGTGGLFNPNWNITHQQMWMILARLTGSNPASMAEARHWAIQGGYADGSAPTAPVKRHQLVTALYRCARLSNRLNQNTTSLAGYNDSRTVPTVARDAFSWALANGIVSGSADKNLMPNGNITRAQFAVILYRYSQRT